MQFVLILFGLLVSGYLFPFASYAQCPVCIVTVGGGMLLAKELGIDDLLVSIWISALNTAIAFYLASKIKTKPLNNPWLLSLVLLLTTLVYFQFSGQTMHPGNQLFGIDKIYFGQILGMLTMFVGNFIYGFTKYKNNGKALFPYSKVVFPVATVLIITFIFKIAFNL